MVVVELISNSEILKQSLTEFIHFMGWDMKVSSQQVKSSFSNLDADFMVIGDEDKSFSTTTVLERIRKRNPIKPIIVIAHNLSEDEKIKCRDYQPFFPCSWPFSRICE